MLFKHKYGYRGSTFDQLVCEALEECDYYSGGQLEHLTRQLKNTQRVLTLLTNCLTEDQKIILAKELNWELVEENEVKK